MRTRYILLGVGVLAAAGGGYAWWQGSDFSKFGLTAVGRGEPIPGQSTADITVLEEGVVVPLGGVPSASVTVVTPVDGISLSLVPQPETTRALTDVNGLKLGTTLALLTQAYANGGPLARSLADTAYSLADAAQGSGALVESLMVLRQGTPQGGPVTNVALVAEAQRTLNAGAPKDLAENNAALAQAEAAKSWWRRQLEKFVTIREGDAPTVDAWTRNLLVAQQQVARGNASDGLKTLTVTPLSDDVRLEPLRGLVREYLDQQGRLTNVMHAYVRAYLNPQFDANSGEAR